MRSRRRDRRDRRDRAGFEEGPAAVPTSDDGDTYQRFRMQFDCVNFQQNPETLQFQRYQFKY